MSEWKWTVRCYYANDVKPPKVPGDLAIETRHKTDASKEMEVRAGESRSDIGRVDAFRIAGSND